MSQSKIILFSLLHNTLLPKSVTEPNNQEITIYQIRNQENNCRNDVEKSNPSRSQYEMCATTPVHRMHFQCNILSVTIINHNR